MQQLMKKGTTFRDAYLHTAVVNETTGPDELVVLRQTINEYVRVSAEINEIPRHWYHEWAGKLIAKTEERYQEIQAARHNAQGDAQQQAALAQHGMQAFTEEYAILTGDKAKNTYVVHCKPWLSFLPSHALLSHTAA